VNELRALRNIDPPRPQIRMHLHRNNKELLIEIQVNDMFAVDIGIKEQFMAPVFHEPIEMTRQPGK
jgi:hypothetical protein